MGKGRCERKAFHHRVYPDRNRIRSRVKGTSVVLYKSVLGILRRDTNPYLKLTEVRNSLVSLQYFMVAHSVQFMKRLGKLIRKMLSRDHI